MYLNTLRAVTWHALSGLWTLVLPRSYARNRSEIKLLLQHLLKPLQHLCQDLTPHRALMLDLEPVVGREKGRANVAVIAYFDCLFACLFVYFFFCWGRHGELVGSLGLLGPDLLHRTHSNQYSETNVTKKVVEERSHLSDRICFYTAVIYIPFRPFAKFASRY